MYLLDTNTVSAYLKHIEPVRGKLAYMLLQEEPMLIDGIIYYEIKGGLLHVNATAQLHRFDQLLQNITILWLNRTVADKASEIYAELRRNGQTIPATYIDCGNGPDVQPHSCHR